MPVGIQRLNQRHKHPNDRIVFIKPLPGPDEAISKDFLERVAAICVPIMKSAAISVMTLEEYEPNREFLGRNFNAGEVIQLVLKSKSGRWLPFNFVQMVMMHELAHCLQMNHGKNFWKVNNQFRDELKALWHRGYTGEGIWGQGRNLYNGQLTAAGSPADGDIPESLCGGTYRSRRRKRKRDSDSSKPSYAEQKQRRIEKKFGVAGSSLGADEDTRILLERGKAAGRPRVAKSKRGRDLAAAAALLRFQQNKAVEMPEAVDQASQSSESDSEDSSDLDQSTNYIKICDTEDTNHDENARREIEELHNLEDQDTCSTDRAAVHHQELAETLVTTETQPQSGRSEQSHSSPSTRTSPPHHPSNPDATTSHVSPNDTAATTDNSSSVNRAAQPPSKSVSIGSISFNPPAVFNAPFQRSNSPPFRFPSPEDPVHNNGIDGITQDPLHSESQSGSAKVVCRVCSLENEAFALTCAACANVLDPHSLPKHWRCSTEPCMTVGYANSADAGVCGLCGVKQPGLKL